MLYVIHTTGQCNLKCAYCGGSFPKQFVPWEIKYSISSLKEIAKREEIDICFYGGEPLLNGEFIKEVIKCVPAKRFIVQTNGLLVKEFDPKFWENFDTILLSIDGVRDVTDFYRGEGIYDRVVEAAHILKESGYRGDVVARMALAEEGDIFRDVTHLLSLNLFNHVHWQLNVVWSQAWKNFEKWVETNYMPGIKKLVYYWINNMQEGRVLGIAPFQGVLRRMIYGGVAPPCGAATDMLSISTDGRILACPIAFEERWAELSTLNENKKDFRTCFIKEPCTDCDVFKECGGRCLYAYMERFWGEDGFNKICEFTKELIFMIRSERNKILDLVSRGKIREEELFYPSYNNSIEIIP
ncbi:MAG: TIGR04084 family radical SAM/SPASM domain-containing protein [Nitrososphaeria archaeon]|jgi:putative peptide-modifying radical SAM enzyme